MPSRRSRSTTRNPLDPPPPGLGDFWATVHVKFPVSQTDEDDPTGTPRQGYYRNFGVRSAPSRVHKVLERTVDDGVIDWDDTEWSYIDTSELDSDLAAQIKKIAGEGVWYRSGRIFYADPDLEPQPN